MTLQPDAAYMQGKRTESAFFMVPVGTQVTSARWAKSEPRTASRAQRCVHDKCLLKSYSGVQTGTGGLGGGHSPSRQDTGTGSLSPCWDLWCLKGWLWAEREGAQMSLWAVAVRRLLTFDLD